jgi:hypothetical protein
VEIAEARPGRREGTYLLTGTVAAVHRACQERPVAAHVVADGLGESLETVDDVVASLCERGLMWVEGDAAVTLAVPVGS